jgi:hypothetical protein
LRARSVARHPLLALAATAGHGLDQDWTTDGGGLSCGCAAALCGTK